MRPDPARRLTPWLVLAAFGLTLSTLALRDRLDAPTPVITAQPAMPMLVLASR